MADRGAKRIKQLLETPSPAFATPIYAIQADFLASDPEDGTVRSSTFTSIEALRSAFGRLARQITAIDTSSAGPKGEVLAALTRMDTGLENLSSGLEQATGDGAKVAFENADRRLRRASNDLARAGGRIA
jgi:hypothetical protein